MDFGINALHRFHRLNDGGGCWEAIGGRGWRQGPPHDKMPPEAKEAGTMVATNEITQGHRSTGRSAARRGRCDRRVGNSTVRNRTYNPPLDRWVQGDPVGYQGGANLYEYVGGSPGRTQDPTGQRPVPHVKPPPGRCWTGDCVENCLIAVKYYVPATSRDEAGTVCESCCLAGHCRCVDAMVLGTKIGKQINKGLK